jgi:hypothetical protein
LHPKITYLSILDIDTHEKFHDWKQIHGPQPDASLPTPHSSTLHARHNKSNQQHHIIILSSLDDPTPALHIAPEPTQTEPHPASHRILELKFK